MIDSHIVSLLSIFSVVAILGFMAMDGVVSVDRRTPLLGKAMTWHFVGLHVISLSFSLPCSFSSSSTFCSLA